jgi:hypothetical protein
MTKPLASANSTWLVEVVSRTGTKLVAAVLLAGLARWAAGALENLVTGVRRLSSARQ